MEYKRFIEGMRELANSSWIFYGKDNKDGVNTDAFETNFIDEIEMDFVDVMTDFYSVEALNCMRLEEKRELDDLRKISDYHKSLLRMKWVYVTKLNNYLDVLIQQKHHKAIDINIANYDSKNVLKLWEFLFEEPNYEKSLEKLYVLNLIYNLMIENIVGRQYENIIKTVYYSGFSIEVFLKKMFNYTEKVLNFLNRELKECQLNMLNSNTFKFLEKKDFEKLRKIFHIKDFDYKYRKAFGDEKIGIRKDNCYATMEVDGNKYITINGIKDKEGIKIPRIATFVNSFKKLLNMNDEGLEYVGIANKTRYYIRKERYIIYSDYINKVSIGKNYKYNRMFTCCERKLLAKLFMISTIDNKEIKLTVSKPPCLFCQRAIDALDNGNEKYVINVRTYEPQLTRCKIREMDNFAKKLLVKPKKVQRIFKIKGRSYHI